MNPLKAIKSFFEKKSSVRDYEYSSDPNHAYIYGVSDNRPVHITPRMTYYLEDKSADLGKAITDISTDISRLKKGLQLSEDTDIDFNHPFIMFLNSPGGGMTASQFWFHIAESFLLNEEIYLVARGNINRLPLETVFIRPYDVTITMDETTGEPSSIQTTSNKDRRNYTREVINGKTRYISRDQLNELIPIRGALSIQDEWRGRSPLVRLFYDVSMNTAGKRHNVSLLENGMRTTGVLSPKGGKDGLNATNWNAKQVQLIEEHVRAFNQGSSNAGNVMIIGSPLDLQGLQQNNKDMDFLELLKNSKETIYNLYSYPLPLVATDTMTLDNYTIAGERYYTEAVLPKFDQIAAGLVVGLGDRFKVPPQAKLTYSTADIEALQKAAMRDMKNAKETETLAINEVRNIGGYDNIIGGEAVLVSSSKVTLDAVLGGGEEFPDMTEDERAILQGGGAVDDGSNATDEDEAGQAGESE